MHQQSDVHLHRILIQLSLVDSQAHRIQVGDARSLKDCFKGLIRSSLATGCIVDEAVSFGVPAGSNVRSRTAWQSLQILLCHGVSAGILHA